MLMWGSGDTAWITERREREDRGESSEKERAESRMREGEKESRGRDVDLGFRGGGGSTFFIGLSTNPALACGEVTISSPRTCRPHQRDDATLFDLPACHLFGGAGTWSPSRPTPQAKAVKGQQPSSEMQ